ncbi:hypothetical protein M0D21_08270 [Aquimarina sp. D1M17]|uniref:hypothetical protein n=1 Tax=Aquimarina acroporae TaxID=2937283 RepID=UPI0020BF528E|nr:hypothetical protein [Aquimarina acroporae]MCK8521560.1 hypothetical protein [Aquimarina acroporae]
MGKESKKEEQERIYWQTAADNELNSSEWFGAIIRYFWHLGRKKFNTFYNPAQLKKNAIIGNLAKILLMLAFFAFLYFKYYYPLR